MQETSPSVVSPSSQGQPIFEFWNVLVMLFRGLCIDTYGEQAMSLILVVDSVLSDEDGQTLCHNQWGVKRHHYCCRH